MIQRLRKSSSMMSLSSDAEDHDRQRADDDEPAHPGVEVAAVLRLERATAPTSSAIRQMSLRK